jgi:hypothetical protein
MAELLDILQHAEQLFFKYGIKSISMDDLSREMGISKKTLYSFVENKEELVMKVMQNFLHGDKCRVEDSLKNASNSIDEFIMMQMDNFSRMHELNSSTLYDIQKYYPQCWKLFTEHKEKYIYAYMIQNLTKGQEEGLYRADLNAEIIAHIYINSIEILIQSGLEKFEKKSIVDLIREYVTYHLHGIVSEKGKEYLNNNLNKIN